MRRFIIGLGLVVLLVPHHVFALLQVPPSTPRNPVVIIPGILGTEMFEGTNKLWPNVAKMALSFNDRFMDPLGFSLAGSPINAAVLAGQVIGKELAFDYTEALLKDLKNNGYVAGQNLFLFPYDWRQDLSMLANRTLKNFLTRLLSQQENIKFDIVAHSQGGLIIKKLLFDHPELQSKINQVIYVGTPQLGAPKAAKTLLYGDDLGMSSAGISFLDPQEVKRIGQNMPSLYALLPSLAYFLGGGYLGSILRPSNQVTYQSYADTQKTLASGGLNKGLLLGASQFHSPLFDSYALSPSIKTSVIAGCNQPTMTAILYKNNGKYGVEYGPGDATVPLQSATASLGSNIWYVSGAQHSRMLSNVAVRQQVINLVTGSNLAVPSVNKNPEGCHIDGWQVSVHSPVDLHVYNEVGEHLGPISNGGLETGLDGAQYDIIEDEKFAFLPSNHVYTVKVNATGKGLFSLHVSKVAQDAIISAAYYTDIPITESSKGEVRIIQQADKLLLDYDGNGIVDREIAPQAVEVKRDCLPRGITKHFDNKKGLDNFSKHWSSIIHKKHPCFTTT